MKIYTENKSYELHFQEVRVQSGQDSHLLTNVNAILRGHSLFCDFLGNQEFEEAGLSHSSPGVAISTSGTSGERIWVFHPWEHFERRYQNNFPGLKQAAFLSFEHAAGIEFLYGRLKEELDFGLFSPGLSPANALGALVQLSPEIINLTPSTFQRLIAYPPLREWVSYNVSQVYFGGESVREELDSIWRETFPGIRFFSRFGTTETLSVRTKQQGSLVWHYRDDPEVEVDFKDGKLKIKSRTLFTHKWDGQKFVLNTNEWWETGDEVEARADGAFRIHRSSHRKYHGLKVFPQEWEKELTRKFHLDWIQIIQQDDQSFEGIAGLNHQVLLDELKKTCLKNGWPVHRWKFQDSPEITYRGKLKR